MHETGGGARFPAEPPGKSRIVAAAQQLDRDRLLELQMIRAPHYRHAAMAELQLEPVLAGEHRALLESARITTRRCSGTFFARTFRIATNSVFWTGHAGFTSSNNCASS